ncbi:IS630 transposase-related protein [Moraxella sp.]|uniref:IS630 transposase-related protein n=1 Tax=Moraxella sp. TaxID=479 RepID=UPI0034C6A9F8
MAYEVELKQKVLAHLGQCDNISTVCTTYNISRGTLYAWIKNKNKDVLCITHSTTTYTGVAVWIENF